MGSELGRLASGTTASAVDASLPPHSEKASALLDDWDTTLTNFVKVVPKDYRRALLELQAEREAAAAAAQ